MPSYASIRSSLKTGDIALFSGKGGISSVIKLFSGGKWSHVGMILCLSEFDNAVMLWESTTLTNIPDYVSGTAIKGVQVVPFSQRIQNYDGDVSIRRLSKSVTKGMHDRLVKLRHDLSRKPYERSEVELLRAAYDGPLGSSPGEDLSSVFCSELVAEAYQKMGLLPEYPGGLPSNEYTPMDFSDRRSLELHNGYELEGELAIS